MEAVSKVCSACRVAKPLSEFHKKLDAAATVLAAAGSPMQVKPLADAVIAKGLWSGKSEAPSQTLSAQIQREINTKGKDSRFARAGRGLFVCNQ